MMTPPGRLIDLGTHRLHLACQGDGQPAVVFDAALGASSLSWTLVQPAIARVTRACAYDRAGFGWSEAGPFPRTAGRIARELHALLRAADLAPPYLLVGHSYGGFVMRVFAARYPADTAGLLLLDPPHPEDWLEPAGDDRRRIARGVRLCRHGAVAARLGLARLVAALAGLGALGPARALARAIGRGSLTRADEGILAPIWKLPPEARRPLRRFWTEAKFYEALGSQIGSICESAAEVRDAAAGGYGDLPLLTISPSDAGQNRLRRQEALARLSSRGRHVIAPGPGHWIPLEQPQVVIDEVLDMLRAIRAGTPPAGGFESLRSS